jgi:hypothetical protein
MILQNKNKQTKNVETQNFASKNKQPKHKNSLMGELIKNKIPLFDIILYFWYN